MNARLDIVSDMSMVNETSVVTRRRGMSARTSEVCLRMVVGYIAILLRRFGRELE